MKLTVLGSGLTVTSTGLTYRYPSAHLLEINDQKILLDTGIGVLPQLSKLGLQITDINTICISHYHADHFNIEPLLQAIYVLNRSNNKRSALHILGPSDIERRVKAGWELHGWKYDELTKYADIIFSPYNDNEPINIGNGILLIGYRTKHFTLESYSLRIVCDGRVFAYSGDSVASVSLVKAAKNADIFLCEASLDINEDTNNGHITPGQAGEVSSKAAVKKLILVHYSSIDSSDQMIEEVKKFDHYAKIEVAGDLDEYMIS